MGAKLGGGGRGRRGSHRRARQMMSDINVTPLVDVMLVLLIVFMVTAPLLASGVNINLPKAHARALQQSDNAPLEIALDANGHIYVGQTSVDAAKLQAMLAAIAVENPDKRIFIHADQSLSYGKVAEVMGIINVAGFTKVALVTDPSTAQGR